jgi:2-keto-4-pentenoate hydratase/2-oxohepta-3-ene-1,7-dioic acid hydratase in catechol pathway
LTIKYLSKNTDAGPFSIVAYGTVKGVGVGGTTAEKSIGQMIRVDEVTDRYDV